MKLIILNYETGEVIVDLISDDTASNIEDYLSNDLDLSLDNINYMLVKDLTIKYI